MIYTENAAPAFPYRPLHKRAILALLLIGAYIIVALVSISSGLAEIDLLEKIANGGYVSDAEVVSNDNRQLAVSNLYLISYASVVISFLIWLNRASKNLSSIGVMGQRFSPGWAIGWWFVPIAYLWKPYQVTAEIWRGSHPGSDPNSPLLGVWWGAWVISNWVLNLILLVYFRDQSDATVEELIVADVWYVASDIISALAGVLLFVLVWRITANQNKKYAATSNTIAGAD